MEKNLINIMENNQKKTIKPKQVTTTTDTVLSKLTDLTETPENETLPAPLPEQDFTNLADISDVPDIPNTIAEIDPIESIDSTDEILQEEIKKK